MKHIARLALGLGTLIIFVAFITILYFGTMVLCYHPIMSLVLLAYLIGYSPTEERL